MRGRMGRVQDKAVEGVKAHGAAMSVIVTLFRFAGLIIARSATAMISHRSFVPYSSSLISFHSHQLLLLDVGWKP
jgi:hypothetical protein